MTNRATSQRFLSAPTAWNIEITHRNGKDVIAIDQKSFKESERNELEKNGSPASVIDT